VLTATVIIKSVEIPIPLSSIALGLTYRCCWKTNDDC